MILSTRTMLNSDYRSSDFIFDFSRRENGCYNNYHYNNSNYIYINNNNNNNNSNNINNNNNSD